MKKPTILITGFGPFPGQPHNPSMTLAARLLAVPVRDDFNLHARFLPTAYGMAPQMLREAVAEVKPDIVICFGVAAARDKVGIERAGWNVVDPDKKDVTGAQVAAGCVRADGPQGYGSNLPFDELTAGLRGAHAELSDNAGDYLCNYMLYSVLDDIARGGTGVRGGFVHIPDPDKDHGMTIMDIQDIAERILKICAADATPAARPKILGADDFKRRGPAQSL